MNDLYIKWDRGYMNIHMDKFFPCSIADFKKVLKTIELDWEHEEELKATLKSYFQNRIPKLPEEAEAKRREAADYRNKAAKAKADLKAEKKRIKSGGNPPYKEFKLQSDYDNYRFLAQQAESEAKRLLKSKQSFERYLEML